VKDIKSLAIRDVKHPGFDLQMDGTKVAPDTSGQSEPGAKADVVDRVSEICFNCWSAGKGKYCAMHLTEARADRMRSSESALMCKNWNLDVLQTRYRSEAIQEVGRAVLSHWIHSMDNASQVFMKSASSLRFDKQRKRFVTVEEFKHPIYRSVSVLLAKYNFTFRRKLHQSVWLRSLIETLRSGKIPREGAGHSAA
jgi:hypothetical protein